MKKVIRLTESDLTRIVKRLIKESSWEDDDKKSWKEVNKDLDDLSSEYQKRVHVDKDFNLDDLNDKSLSVYHKMKGLKNKRGSYVKSLKQEIDNLINKFKSEYSIDDWNSDNPIVKKIIELDNEIKELRRN